LHYTHICPLHTHITHILHTHTFYTLHLLFTRTLTHIYPTHTLCTWLVYLPRLQTKAKRATYCTGAFSRMRRKRRRQYALKTDEQRLDAARADMRAAPPPQAVYKTTPCVFPLPPLTAIRGGTSHNAS